MLGFQSISEAPISALVAASGELIGSAVCSSVVSANGKVRHHNVMLFTVRNAISTRTFHISTGTAGVVNVSWVIDSLKAVITINSVEINPHNTAPSRYADRVGTITANMDDIDSVDYGFLPSPQIDSISPTSGPELTDVTITGINFTGVSSVRIGDYEAVFVTNSDTEIVATIPVGAVSRELVVKHVFYGSARSKTRFIVS